MKQKILTFTLIILVNFTSSLIMAQEKVKEIYLKDIHGTAIGNNNESIDQVTNKATNTAKIEALKKAGIEENISSYTDFFQSEYNDDYDELFATEILSNIRGAVKNVEIVDAKKTFDEFENLKVVVNINCTVVKYLSDKDLTYDVWIDGIGIFYKNESKLLFKIKSTKDTYVSMFIFNEKEAYKLFPNELESSFLLKKNIEYEFPTYKADYILETKKKSEAHRLIVVFTKEEIPYTGEIEYKQIIDWVFSIPPDMRVIKSFGFNVVNENKLTD